MRKILSNIGNCIVLVLVLAAAPAGAQTAAMRVVVPFAFLAGEETHPAGMYTVKVDESHGILELRSVSGTDLSRLGLGSGFQGAAAQFSKGVLRFTQYGNSWSLSGIWASGADRGFKVRQSKAQADLAKAHPDAVEVSVGAIQ